MTAPKAKKGKQARIWTDDFWNVRMLGRHIYVFNITMSSSYKKQNYVAYRKIFQQTFCWQRVESPINPCFIIIIIIIIIIIATYMANPPRSV